MARNRRKVFVADAAFARDAWGRRESPFGEFAMTIAHSHPRGALVSVGTRHAFTVYFGIRLKRGVDRPTVVRAAAKRRAFGSVSQNIKCRD